MSILIIILFLLTLPTVLFTLKKILKKKDINFFDINILATFLYFIFIPTFYYITGEKYAIDLLEKGIPTYIIVDFYIYIIFFINRTVSNSSKYESSLFNISYQLRKLYNKIGSFNRNYLYFIIFILTLNLYSNLSYSNLQGKNLSNADMEAVYTEQTTGTDRINNKLKGIYNFLLIPSLLYGIIIIKKSPEKFYKNIGWIVIGSSSLVLLLGSRRPMIAALIFVLLFLYSISREKIKKKTILKLALVFGLIIGVFFPAYQVYRLVKEYSLLNETKVDFMSVIYNSKELISNYEVFQEAQESNSKRSLNLFSALDKAVKNETYDGWVVWQCITNFMPGSPSLEDNVEFQLANKYAHYGADIADSILMYSVADFSFLGCVFALFYIWLFYKLNQLFIFLFKKNNIYCIFTIYFLYQLYNISISLEFSPFWSIKNLSNTLLYAIIIAILFYFLSKLKSKNIL